MSEQTSDRHGYDGWGDGQTFCLCGSTFPSVDAFSTHIDAMTSVPPTQPPAAPESDVRLTEAERAVIESWLRLGDDHPLAGSIADRELFATVERIVADRVRVVEGERDAALAEAAEMSGWIEEHALVTTLARIAEWQEATGAELPAMARAAMTAYAARAESAEAAHEALVERVRRECDFAEEHARHVANDEVLVEVGLIRHALLPPSGGAR